jgi:hypothetical protein
MGLFDKSNPNADFNGLVLVVAVAFGFWAFHYFAKK